MTSIIRTGPAALKDITEHFYMYSTQYHILDFYEMEETASVGLQVSRTCSDPDEWVVDRMVPVLVF